MLVVKIELWPYGNENEKEELGRMEIINDGSGTLRRGNYDVRVCRKDNYDKYVREGRVEGYARKSYSVWELVKRSLNNFSFT